MTPVSASVRPRDARRPAEHDSDGFRQGEALGVVYVKLCKKLFMAEADAVNMPDGKDLLRGMGWDSLPFSCLGLIRRTGQTSGNNIWSWIILVPWAANDSKPWIDGVEIIDNPLMKEEDQRSRVLGVMRAALDDRYGETVGSRAVDDLLKRLQDEG